MIANLVPRLSLALEAARREMELCNVVLLEHDGQTIFPLLGGDGKQDGCVFYLGPVGSDKHDRTKWVEFRFNPGEYGDPWSKR